MATWFTADLHLGHHNIIDYCRRSFTDVVDMNAALVANWNDTVAPDDTVWVLGDFALGTIAESLPLAGRLHGRKVLVAGNHDRCWDGHGRRAEGWTERYLAAGSTRSSKGRPAPMSAGARCRCVTSRTWATVTTRTASPSSVPPTSVTGSSMVTSTIVGTSATA